MVDPVTTNRGFAQPAHASDVDTWDVPVNGNMSLLDTILGGVTAISSTGGLTTLNSTQLAGGTISVSGAMASNITLLFPAIQGWWSIENLTTGNNSFAVLVASGTGATLIGIPPGGITDIQINGNTPKYRNLPMVGSEIHIVSASIPKWISQCTVAPYLNEDGSTFSAGTYPQLNEYLGGNTLPDSRGRARFNLNQGTSRVNASATSLDGNTLLAGGGSQQVTQAVLPNVTFPNSGITVSNGAPTIGVVNTGSTLGQHGITGNAGSASIVLDTPGTIVTNVSIASQGQASSGGSGQTIVPPGYVGGLTLIRAA